VLAQDVTWDSVVEQIRKDLPAGVFLSSFTGTHTIPVAVPGASTSAAATPTAPAGTATPTPTQGTTSNPNDLCAGLTGPTGTVSMSGSAPNLPSVSQLVDQLRKDPDLAVLWVSTVTAKSDKGVDFNVSAALGSSARGHRLESFFKGTPCK
jgi:hypothetical protein